MEVARSSETLICIQMNTLYYSQENYSPNLNG
jgi:hypothetical protein